MDTVASLPLAIYGHSFGALIGFELARRLEARGGRVATLIVGAAPAPHQRSSGEPIYALPQREFLDGLSRRYGTPRELLDNPDYLELSLRAYRADLQAVDTYTYEAGPSLQTPLSVLYGTRDPSMSVDDANAWRSLTTEACSVHSVDGGHLFVDTHREWTIARVLESLS